MTEKTNIKSRLADKLEDIEKGFDEFGPDEEGCRPEDDILEITTLKSFDILLSWGGPGDGFRLMYSPAKESWVGGVYYFIDWGESLQEPLTADQAEKVAEYYGICPE